MLTPGNKNSICLLVFRDFFLIVDYLASGKKLQNFCHVSPPQIVSIYHHFADDGGKEWQQNIMEAAGYKFISIPQHLLAQGLAFIAI